ncbi:MAG TPA: glycosyl transferase family 90, partial [Rhabdochlamydiaceae bacterium]
MFTLKYAAKYLVLLFFWVSLVEGLNPELLYSKMKAPTPEWMVKQIQNDLAPFTTELSRKYLDELFAREELALFRVQVVDGYLTVKKSWKAKHHLVPDQVIPHLLMLHVLKTLPDMDLVFSAHDTFEWLPKGPDLPIFIITKFKEDTGYILFPDWYALRGFEPDKSQILQGNSIYPWESKSKMLFFRGGDSGIFDKSKWISYPRPVLMGLAVGHPDLIDAKFTHIFHTEHAEFVNRSGYMGNFVSMQDHPRYRYL